MARILVVDDDDVISELVTYKLRHLGHDVVTAADGEAGLRQARTDPYDLLLLDLMMPRMTGIEVCRRLRAEGVDTPVIMLTAKVQEQDVEEGFAAGADDYVTKPISLVELTTRVNSQLQRRRRGATPRAPSSGRGEGGGPQTSTSTGYAEAGHASTGYAEAGHASTGYAEAGRVTDADAGHASGTWR